MQAGSTIAEPRPAEPGQAAPLPAPAATRTKVAYIMSRFPELTQTFVLFEILAVEQQSVAVELFPLLRGGLQARHSDGASLWKKFRELAGPPGVQQVMHPEAAPLMRRAHYAPFFSWGIFVAQLYYLLRRPLAYLGVLGTLIRGARGSANFLWGGLAIFPKAVYFARHMELRGISHVHAHFANHPAMAALIVHRLTGIPYSFTAHGSDLHRDRRLLREKVAEAAFVVAISKFNRQVIEEHCGASCRDRLEIIHCGVDTTVFRPAGERIESSERLLILSVGTLHEVKGQTYLIQACAALRDRGVSFECLFVGDGPDRDMLTNQIQAAGLQDCVRLLGQKTRREIVELMQRCHVLVTPSVPSRSGRREGIPVVLMEGMACGLPVVASDLSGIPELVEDGVSGLLIPPGDVSALADALARLQQDSALCRDLGQGAREKVLQEFNQQKNAALLAERFAESSVA